MKAQLSPTSSQPTICLAQLCAARATWCCHVLATQWLSDQLAQAEHACTDSMSQVFLGHFQIVPSQSSVTSSADDHEVDRVGWVQAWEISLKGRSTQHELGSAMSIVGAQLPRSAQAACMLRPSPQRQQQLCQAELRAAACLIADEHHERYHHRNAAHLQHKSGITRLSV
jgi:hypothetical protein